MDVRVTDDAKADLQQIKAYISERNVIAAEGVALAGRLTRSADELTKMVVFENG
jgi:hypothetical protein